MLAAFIFPPSQASFSLLCFYSGSYFFSLVKTVLITKRRILHVFSVTFSWVHECECFRKRKQHRFFFSNWKMKCLFLGGAWTFELGREWIIASVEKWIVSTFCNTVVSASWAVCCCSWPLLLNVLLFLLVGEVPIDFAIAPPSGACGYCQSC